MLCAHFVHYPFLILHEKWDTHAPEMLASFGLSFWKFLSSRTQNWDQPAPIGIWFPDAFESDGLAAAFSVLSKSCCAELLRLPFFFTLFYLFYLFEPLRLPILNFHGVDLISCANALSEYWGCFSCSCEWFVLYVAGLQCNNNCGRLTSSIRSRARLGPGCPVQDARVSGASGEAWAVL